MEEITSRPPSPSSSLEQARQFPLSPYRISSCTKVRRVGWTGQGYESSCLRIGEERYWIYKVGVDLKNIQIYFVGRSFAGKKTLIYGLAYPRFSRKNYHIKRSRPRRGSGDFAWRAVQRECADVGYLATRFFHSLSPRPEPFVGHPTPHHLLHWYWYPIIGLIR